MRLNVESGLPLANGIIGAGGEIQWPAPTRPGDILHVESEVKEGEKFIKDNDWDVSVLDEQEQLDATVALTLSLGGSEQPPKPDVAGGKERGRDDH